MRPLAPLAVVVLALLATGCGADAGSTEASATPPPTEPRPDGTPLSSLPPPTRSAQRPPTTPSDLVRPRTETGKVLRTDGCTYLVTDLTRLPLRGDLARELADGAQVTLLVRPLPQLSDPCGDGPVQVVEIRR